jgi:site-specific recombinase XerD
MKLEKLFSSILRQKISSDSPVMNCLVTGSKICCLPVSEFRATFATRCLWAGVDLRTVQQWLGHSGMESTMRYLKPSRSQQVREKVNKIFAL